MGHFKIWKIGNLLKRQTPEEEIEQLKIIVMHGLEAKAFKELLFYREVFAPMMYQKRHVLTKQLSNDINGTFLQGKLSILNEIEDFIEKTIEKGRLAKPKLEKLKENLDNG